MTNSPATTYRKVETEEQLDSFFELLHDCHDGLIREIHVVNQSWVKDPVTACLGGTYSIRILLQKVNPPPNAVEIILGNVLKTEIDNLDEIYSASGRITYSHATALPEIHLNFDGASFVSRTMLFRETPESLGRFTRFGTHFSAAAPKGTVTMLEDNWIMCPECTESWELLIRQDIVACPFCDTALLLPENRNRPCKLRS